MAHYSGDCVSSTMGGQVVYESRLEPARLPLADFDPVGSGTVRVVNVRPTSRLEDPTVVQAPARPGQLIERHGWEYEVWSGADRALPENVRFLAA